MNSYRNARANLVQEPPRYSSSPMFVAGATINQTLPIGVSTVTLNTIPTGINDNGCFNPGTSSFVSPRAGRMFLCAQVSVMNTSGTASICSLMFSIDGADVAPKLNTVAGSYANVAFNNQVITEVNVGTVVYLKFYNDASPSLATRAADWGALSTSFFGYYLI